MYANVYISVSNEPQWWQYPYMSKRNGFEKLLEWTGDIFEKLNLIQVLFLF